MATNDDDDEEEAQDKFYDSLNRSSPLSKGVDSISWLPSTENSKFLPANNTIRQGAEVLPLFPLGQVVYTPHSEHILNIFEPRYRQLYKDIMDNGTKKFVVTMSHPTEQGTFAEIGVLFNLDELNEVSEQTNDQIKYICKHRVSGRVRIHRVINPQAWSNRDTYLKVEATIFHQDQEYDAIDLALKERKKKKDAERLANLKSARSTGMIEAVQDALTGALSTSSTDSTDANDGRIELPPSDPAELAEESKLQKTFKELVELQYELQEQVRFVKGAVPTFSSAPGAGDNSLWTQVQMWQAYLQQNLQNRRSEMQKDFQEKLLKYLNDAKEMKKTEIPSVIPVEDLPPHLKKDMEKLQRRMSRELSPLAIEAIMTMQKILEAEDHLDRLKVFRRFVEIERNRLEIRKDSSVLLKRIEQSTEEALSGKNQVSSPFDDPNAFQ